MSPSRYLAGALLLAACQSATTPVADFSTPEGAILKLQEALEARDLEAAMGCRDFETGARIMLERRLSPDEIDAQMIAKNAELLRVAFEQEVQRKGFPDYSQTISRFVSREPFKGREDLVIVTKELTLVDHSKSTQRYLVGRRPEGWRVIGPAD